MKSVILYYLIAHKPLGYILAFFGVMAGGDETLFTASFLTREHFFKFSLMLPILLAGVYLGDLLWFTLGKKLSPDFFLKRWVEKFTRPVDEHLKTRPFRTIFLSKFVYGFNHAILIRAGMLDVPKREFFLADTLAIISWVAVVGGLGYFSSGYLRELRHFLRYTEIALLFGLAGFFVLEALVRYLLKKEL